MRGMLVPLLKGLVFTVVTVLATVLLAVTIANRGRGDEVGYRARFSDATSVNPGDDVRMAGVRIGQVDQVRVVDRRFAEVEFSVDRNRKLLASVSATIKFRNLIGQRYIALDQGAGDPNAVLVHGSLIPIERTRPALDLTAMLNGFKPLFQALSPDDVNKLSFEIVQVLQGEGATVDSLLRHTASLTSTLADKDRVIGQVIDNLNVVLDQVSSRGDKLSSLISTTQQLVSGLAKDSEPIGEAIEGLAALTSSTAGLVADGREPLRRDIDALGDLSKNLADGTPAFERFLANLPIKFEAIGRTASYGGWLNMFLCSASSDAPPAPGGGPVGVPLTEARCRR
ncbi:MAG TPA: MCE family protein [Actinophytocola sp.]|uniref:MCE family protein n=1 Tax=Actinophytocola sp. TaxID=1872138 RepID=UPI002DBCA555|nr:MCE family protein [Actinophytocola sp.]HEU5470299.1 MCE family protein [Actinophytocola sp.]